MRRILATSALLAACLGMASCGSSSNNNNTSDLTALTGNYVFQEQLYTYYSGVDSVHAPASISAKGLHKVAVLGQRSKALSVMHGRTGKVHGVPAQGNVNSSVAWGAALGALQFDGQGNVIGGEIDYNEPTGGGYFSDTLSGSYTVDSDNTATISVISTNAGVEFFFYVGLQGTTNGSAATGAQIVESEEDGVGDVEIGTGTMLPQTVTPAQSTISGNYVFGLQGQTCYGTPCPQDNQGDLYVAGLLNANGSGTFGSASEADVSDGFENGNLNVTGSYVAPDSMGRMPASLSTTPGLPGGDAGALPTGYVFYIANASTFFILSTDNNNTQNGLSPYLFGQAGAQTGSPSLSGNYVLSESTEDLANENTSTPDTYSDVYLALLSASGSTLTGTGDSNKAGTVTSNVAYNYGTYTVASNGRVTFTGGSTPAGAGSPVFWLQSSSFAYGVDQLNGNSSQQEPGLISLYQQSGSSFSASSINGLYALGTLPASTSLATFATGTVSADGSSKLTGDVAVQSLTNAGTGSLSATYTVAANGRGTTTGGSGSFFGNEVLYVASPSLVLGFDVSSGDSAPSIQTLQP